MAFRTDAAPVTNIPPTVALTSPTQGATFVPPATVTLSANAADADGTIAKVEFFQNSVLVASDTTAPYSTTRTGLAAGNYTLSAKATDSKGAVSTLSSASIYVGAPRITLKSPVGNAAPAGENVLVQGGFVGGSAAAVWVDNGQSMRLATQSVHDDGTRSFHVYLPLYVGPNPLTISVVRADKTHDTMTFNVDGVLSPSVEFTAPGTDVFDAPATVNLAVAAASPNGPISQVRFFANNTPLATVMAPPYTHTWSVPAVGKYEVSATAVDSSGYEATARKSITVRGANVLPTIQITSPLANASFDAPGQIGLSATAGDSDGTIQSVEYFANGTFLFATNIAPFNGSWSGVAAGNYVITARAVDDRGAIGTAAPVSVSVVTPKSLLQMTSPASGVSHIAPAVINLAVAAIENTIAVTYYRTDTGTNQEIGTSTAAPFNLTWTMRTPGTFTVVAKALITMAGSTEPFSIISDPITVVVKLHPSGETITYLHNDLLGSPIAATDANGGLIWREDYAPYGERTEKDVESATNRQFFAGKPLDKETGLSYVNARYYDPHSGRFMAIDPVGFGEPNIHSFNRYAYANNNPYRYIDPDGRQSLSVNNMPYFSPMVQMEIGVRAWYGQLNKQTTNVLMGASMALGGPGSAVAKEAAVITEASIAAVLKGSSMRTAQESVSLPMIKEYVARSLAGEVAPAILVDGKFIVNGHHRYIAGLIAGKPVATTEGTAAMSQLARAKPLEQIKITQKDLRNPYD